MRVYYDTEFIEDGRTIDLVSIGMVADDGRELYAVSSEFDQHALLANSWLAEHVWPALPTTEPHRHRDGLPPHGRLDLDDPAVRTRAQIARAVHSFLTATRDVQLWAWYGAYDHVALAQLFGPMTMLPSGIPMWTNDVRQEYARLGDPAVPPQPDGEHHALADARHVKVMIDAIQGR